MRDRHVDAMWGLSAVALVMAARYQPAFLLYPVAAFGAGFLFFVAGYAARGDCAPGAPGTRNRPTARETWGTLGVAYAGTALAALAALLLERAGLSPGGPVPSVATTGGALAALRDLALAPLGGAAPPALFPAAWMLAAVFLASALLRALRADRGRLAPAGVALVAGVVAVVLAADGGELQPGLRRFVVRTGFAVAFFSLGHLARAAGERTRRRVRSPTFLAAGFILVDVLAVGAGGLGYRIEAGDLGRAGPTVSLVTTAVIVLMAAAVAFYAAEVVGARSALLGVGRSWRPILAGHAAVLFAIDVSLALAGALPRADLARPAAALDLNRLWVLYLVPAVAVPALLALAAARARRGGPAAEEA